METSWGWRPRTVTIARTLARTTVSRALTTVRRRSTSPSWTGIPAEVVRELTMAERSRLMPWTRSRTWGLASDWGVSPDWTCLRMVSMVHRLVDGWYETDDSKVTYQSG